MYRGISKLELKRHEKDSESLMVVCDWCSIKEFY